MGFWPSIPTISSRRSIGRSMIPKLQAKGFSTPKALSWLKEHKGSYRKTDFLSDWRQYLGIARKKDALKHVRKDYLPTSRVMEKTYDIMSAKYKATYKVFATNIETGQEQNYHISIVSDKRLKMSYWDELADMVAHNETYTRQIDIDSLEIESMLEQAE